MAGKKFSIHTYDPSAVILTIAGYQVTGWENITIARRADSFIPVYGIRGKHTRTPTNDTSALITIPLLQTSPTNEVFSTIHGLDLERGTGRLALTLKDGSGRSVFSSNEAYIVGYPEAVFSGDFEYTTWRIICQTTSSYIIGGNARPPGGLLDSITSSLGGAASAVSGAVSNIF